jgi:hypothetical protein
VRDEVGERYDDHEDVESSRRREKSKGGGQREAKDDEEGREDEGRPNEGEERRTAATIANVNGQYTTTEAGDLPPESPPFPHHPALPPPSPIHPERPDDVDTDEVEQNARTKTCRRRARPRRRDEEVGGRAYTSRRTT